MRRARILGATTIACLLAGWVLSAALGSAATAGSPTSPTASLSPTPSPTVPPFGRKAIGMKMYPQDYGFARNPEAPHRIGEWYALDGDVDFPTFGVRWSTGRWLVWFPEKRSRGTITVTAAGSEQRCEALSWGPSPVEYPGIDIEVACFSRSGAPVNAPFSVIYRNP